MISSEKSLKTPKSAPLDNSKEKLKNDPKTPKNDQNEQKHQNHQKWPKSGVFDVLGRFGCF